MMSDDKTLSLEQVVEFLDGLGDIPDAKRRSIAKTLGHDLPVPEIADQLKSATVKRGYVGKVSKNNPEPPPTDYVIVPALKLESGGTKALWVKAVVARRIAESILAVCNAEDIK